MSPILQAQLNAPPGDRTGKRPFVRLARFEDYEQIAAIEARHGLTVKSRSEWMDLWLANPAYLELPDWPIGWVADDGEGHIVGTLGNIPSFCRIEGKRYVCASGRGWAVDLPHRAFSVILLAHQVRQRNSDLNLITTPSPTTVSLCAQLGWSRVPAGQWDRSAFWIADYAEVLQGYLDARTPKALSRFAHTMIAPARRLREAIAKRSSAVRGVYQLAWESGFDGRFDDFWQRLTEQKPGVLLEDRDAETLRWHFKRTLRQGRTWILTASKNGALVGYAIFERRDIRSLNMARALVVDVQMLSKDAALCSAMIQFALDRCRREAVHVLENAGCWMETLLPMDPPPHRRNLDVWCYLYRITNSKLQESMRGAASWYPTQYDGDATL